MRKKESIYIAEPECFYTDSPERLSAMGERAESMGFEVTLPNDRPLNMSSENLCHHADNIFESLKQAMLDTTIVLAGLEAYRGSEPDSEAIFEIEMTYAKGAKCYGFTRDKRPCACKGRRFSLQHDVVVDEYGRETPYQGLPLSSYAIGSTRIMEGDFDDCLKLLVLGLEGKEKRDGMRGVPSIATNTPAATVRPLKNGGKPTVYLSGPERYDLDGESIYDRMKKIYSRHGLETYCPLDWAGDVSPVEADSPYTAAANQSNSTCQRVRDCDTVIASLNDFRGYERSNDVGFGCDMTFQLRKKLYDYMDDTRPMKDRVPHLGAEQEYHDMAGASAENFDYPLNLMFSCFMEIWEGKFKKIVEKMAAELLP